MQDESTFAGIYASLDQFEDRDLIEHIATAIYDLFEDESCNPFEWPTAVLNFYTLYDLNFQVGNGGFAQAAYNVPELLPQAVKAFNALGKPQAASFIEEIVQLMPKELQEHLEKGLDETSDIQDVFDHFVESDLAQFDEKEPDEFWVDDALHQYALAHQDVFQSMDTRH